MSMYIYGTIANGVKTLWGRVEHNMERGVNKFCSEWKLADTGNNGFIWVDNIDEIDSYEVKHTRLLKLLISISVAIFICLTFIFAFLALTLFG